MVSTHSRPKAAALHAVNANTEASVSTHSRPKAAARMDKAARHSTRRFNTQPTEGGCILRLLVKNDIKTVSTHSRPKAAAQNRPMQYCPASSFNTQPPEGGCQKKILLSLLSALFQHTAARRRLPAKKADFFSQNSFNTQPPEGGCSLPKKAIKISVLNTVFR